MGNYDAERVSQVWQRVRGEESREPVSQEPLQSLIMEEMSAAAAYLVLSRQTAGKDSVLLRRLFQESHSHGVCLKGICALMEGKRPQVRGMVPDKEPMEATLRRCYGREMRCLAAYEKRSADKEYGPVFARLAEQKREHCRLVLELIGRLK